MSTDQTEKQIEYIRGFEAQLGVLPGFFERLLHEDDWSFLIKLHALVEAASTKLLVEALNKPELQDQIARLPLSDSECGKLSMMKSLGIVTAPYRGFIRKLSELRNQSVHNVQHTSLNLKNIIADSPKSKRNAMADALGVGVRGNTHARVQLLEENPKGLIWVSALCLISIFALHKVSFESTNQIAKLGLEALELVEKLGT